MRRALVAVLTGLGSGRRADAHPGRAGEHLPVHHLRWEPGTADRLPLPARRAGGDDREDGRGEGPAHRRKRGDRGQLPVDSDSEKGLLGVEVDPQFQTNGFLFYASDGPTTANKHRVLRVRLDPTTSLLAAPASNAPRRRPESWSSSRTSRARRTTTAEGWPSARREALRRRGRHRVQLRRATRRDASPTTSGPASPPPTGRSCASTSTAASPRTIHSPLPGRRCRPAPGARAARPNPANVTGTPRTEIWSWGFRNPFRFWFDAQTDRLWVGEVGEVSYEEINLVTKGQHYGWPWREGRLRVSGDPMRRPGRQRQAGPTAWSRPTSVSTPAQLGNNDGDCQSITGGVFVDSASFPAPYRGRYFFGDNANGNVWTLTPNAARDGFVSAPRADFGTGFGTVTRFLVGPDGALYLSRIEGSILRIAPKPGVDAGVPDAGPPDAGPTRRRPTRRRSARRGSSAGCGPHRLRGRYAAGGSRRWRSLPGTGHVPAVPLRRGDRRRLAVHAVGQLGGDHDGQRDPRPAVPGGAHGGQPGRAGHRPVVPALPLAHLLRAGTRPADGWERARCRGPRRA